MNFSGKNRVYSISLLILISILEVSEVQGARSSAIHVSALGSHIVYVSPVPGSAYLTPATNIIVRSDEAINPSSVGDKLFSVTGSSSGAHDGRVVLVDDQRTVLFQPAAPFMLGEKVSVSMVHPLVAVSGDTIYLEPFSFTISKSNLNANKAFIQQITTEMLNQAVGDPGSGLTVGSVELPSQRIRRDGISSSKIQSSTLPSDFPPLTVTVSDSPTHGYIFLATNIQQKFFGNYLIIADNNGNPVFYRNVGQYPALDFTIQPTGVLTYFIANKLIYYVMNTSLQVIDSITAGNGYVCDDHELQILPNGNIFLLADDYEQMDMSKIVPGGDTAATVLDVVVQ
jgi:hypothetical protein